MATHKVETEKHADVMIAKVCKKAFAKGTTLCIKVCLGLEYQVLKIAKNIYIHKSTAKKNLSGEM
jgi:hypothetical protein